MYLPDDVLPLIQSESVYSSGRPLDRSPTAASAFGPAAPNPASASWCPRSILAPLQYTLTPVRSRP
ncbi:hypothetical protein PGTUg99_014644 [Puccinia graminis f. sp. tritici]|uniref:Uncharacterized protein n=1 Tax=Puccinia graminis f. sp. tritici TaxID=56615 RepID=A0A5B0Q930_PUCGR|nr:hypothetical protein PGTUg99_014644 [Puccinia graminis f. sp. tritici]